MYKLSDDLKKKIIESIKPNERLILLLDCRYVKM